MKKCPICSRVLIRMEDKYCISCGYKIEADKNEPERP